MSLLELSRLFDQLSCDVKEQISNCEKEEDAIRLLVDNINGINEDDARDLLDMLSHAISDDGLEMAVGGTNEEQELEPEPGGDGKEKPMHY